MPGMNQPPPESLGIFTGFTLKYPEFTVVTPQMGNSYSVRCLNVSEVSRLKTSATTPSKATDLINRTLWEAIVARPPEITDYDTFLRMTTLRDREALIYGLYISTFGDEREFRVSCDSCNTERTLKVKLSNMFSITPYPGSAGMRNSYALDKASGDVTEPDPSMEEAIMEARAREAEARRLAQEQAMAAIAPQTKPVIDLSAEDDPSASGIGVGAPIKPVVKKKLEPIQRPMPPRTPEMSTPISDSVSGGRPGSMVRVNQSGASMGTILSVDIPVTLPTSSSVDGQSIVCVIHQPTLLDEYEILNNVPFMQRKQSDLINETLIIKRFEVYKDNDSRARQTIGDREDILRGYQSLPNPDKKAIYDAFRDNFADFGISLNTNWDCLNCGEENSMELEIVAQFFRMVAIS